MSTEKSETNEPHSPEFSEDDATLEARSNEQIRIALDRVFEELRNADPKKLAQQYGAGADDEKG